MAEPVCRSLDAPPADVDGPRVFARDGNWRQGQGDDPLTEPLFVKRWSLNHGASFNVEQPPKSQDLAKDPPDPNPAGAMPSGLQGFDFTGLFPAGVGTMEVLFELWASTHSRYVRQDGSVAYDVREWGGSYLDGSPVRFAVTVTKPVAPPPPPPGPTYDQLRDHAKTDLHAALELIKADGRKPRVSAPRAYWAERILADPSPAKAFEALAKVWPT